MSGEEHNLDQVFKGLSSLMDEEPDQDLLEAFSQHTYSLQAAAPKTLIGGIDSSDNLLLRIPYHPGAAVAGYSFSLVVSTPQGEVRQVNERMAERESVEVREDLEIALIYNVPTVGLQRRLHISDYQYGMLLGTPSSRSPYVENLPGEFKVRLAAARHRETTERRAVRTALFQSELKFGLLLKDGRHSSQNVSTRYTDDVGRKAVERGVRYVGVVKQGTQLWSNLFPFHRAIYAQQKQPYWAVIPPLAIASAYATPQIEPKTLRLGATENQSLGGIGGAWVMYGNSRSSFYILEFNVYDLSEYRPLVDNGVPLEIHNQQQHRWSKTYVAHLETTGELSGTQTRISDQDLELLIAPTVNEIHHLAECSHIAPGYPIVLADAHNRCKITKNRKEHINLRLISQFRALGVDVADFDTWSEDPHKIFEN